MKSRSVSDLQELSTSWDATVLPASFDFATDSRGEAPHHQETATVLPDLLPAKSEDGSASPSANAGEGPSAASSFALLDTQTEAGHPGMDSAPASIIDTSPGSGSINLIGTAIQETNSGPGFGLHIGPPVDSDFTATTDALFAPAASAPVQVVSIDLANLTPMSFGHGVEAVANNAGVETTSAHPATQASLDISSDASTPAAGAAGLAYLENSSGGSPITNSGVGSGGATAAQVQAALDESGLSVNGSGIKVGVLSDSFNDLGGAATDEADGALPSASNIQILKDLGSGGSDEGRAMMEIIHDIAPGASLAFYTAFDSERDFANGIIALANAGAKVIVDDVSYFDEPFFQNGVIAQAIQTVEAEGVTYVTAAGNEGSNGYQAAWSTTSGTFDGHALTNAMSFGGSLTQMVTINTEGTGDSVPLVLEWNKAYGSVSTSTADLELLVFQNGSLVGTATNAGDGESTNPWVEYNFAASGTYQVAVVNMSAASTDSGLLIKEITEGDGLPATISGSNTGTVVGHPLTPGAITAGAVSAADTPAFGFSPTSESFSSSGAGAELLFANNGTALSSPDMLNPVAVSGVDDIATSVPGGLSDFYGTSAASASLAGVAALMLSANPNLTPAQVEAVMEQTALSMGNSAVAGAGLAQIDAAVAAVTQPPVVTTSNITELPNQTLAASSLFTVTDPNGYAITEYEFWDRTSDPASGHFYFNGVEVADHTLLQVTAAQLSEVTFVTGTDSNALEVRAFDGVSWSAADNAVWAPFNVNITTPPAPVVTTSNLTENPGQTLAASSLFTVTDPDGLAITEYQFWDRTSDPASGHFYFNGVEVADHTLLDVTAAQLSEVTFVTGTDGNALEVRAFDGVSWSAAGNAVWAPFNVTITTPPPPVVTTSNITENPGQTLAASSLFTVTDPDGLAITEYQFWDRTSDPASGHFYFNGVEVADHTLLDVTAAQLSEVTFVTGTDGNALEVRAFDGVSWSAADNAVWAPFNVTITTPPPPVVTTSNITENPGQTLAASSLFTVSDPDGLAITEYQFWDRTSDPASGHFYFNGIEVADHTLLDVTAAQLSEVTFVTGTDGNALEVRAFDGVSWSAADNAVWAPFNVTITTPPPPVVTTSNITENPGQTLAASSLFTVSDPDGLAITEYQFWDRTSDPASGHFYFNGIEVADHTLLDVTAAQLSEVTFVTGTDSNALEVRAFDGVSWSAADNAVWAPFNVTITPSTSQATPATVATAPATESVTLASTGTVADNFVFAPNFGQATIANFAPASDTIQIDHTMFANVTALLAATHDDTQGNAVITDALHDTITIKNVTTAQLTAHQADFHIV